MTKFLEKRSNPRPLTKKIVIFYHANCTDGFTAAWAAWNKFGSRANYIATFHEDPLPKGLEGKEIYTLDMTFPEPVTRKLLKIAKRLTSVDHHITSRETTKLTYKYSYALHHSGAVLAWKYFHPGKPIPAFVLRVEDMDLFRLKLKETEALYAYLDQFDFSFKFYAKLIKDFEVPPKRAKMMATGQSLLRHERKIIQRLVAENSEVVRFEGHKVLSVNSSVFHSQIGNILAVNNPPFGIVWKQKRDFITVSLRGVGNIDVAKIAEKYGGGGHKHAAAFRLKSVKDIPWKSLK